MSRRLVAVLACRNKGSRLYGKPLQNLDVERNVRIIDNIVECLRTLPEIEEVALAISEGTENEIFREVAHHHKLRYTVGDEVDVLGRLISCAHMTGATDVFRVTTESPFLYYSAVSDLWRQHRDSGNHATFLDNIIDGCGFEIIDLSALEKSHSHGESKHRSEMCTLYIREHSETLKVQRTSPPALLQRTDLRLTVDNPEDLVVCRAVFQRFSALAPRIPIEDVVAFLDSNPHLIELTSKFTETGYSTMYR